MSCVKILVLIFAITIILNYGMHITIQDNAREVRESALTYVQERCTEENTQTWKNQNTILLTGMQVGNTTTSSKP